MSTTQTTPIGQSTVPIAPTAPTTPDTNVTPTANEIINLAQSEVANYRIALENALHEAAAAKAELKKTLAELKEKNTEQPTVQYVEKIKYVEVPQRSFISRLMSDPIPTVKIQLPPEPELGTPINEMFPLFCIPNPLKR